MGVGLKPLWGGGWCWEGVQRPDIKRQAGENETKPVREISEQDASGPIEIQDQLCQQIKDQT